MDYTKLANPYDFANPVMDPELLAGRNKEIADISYYLDHASRTNRAINLAIMGERASGKTSVLNKIQCLAEERGFCVVRIDLDEGDAVTQMGFFYKLFDCFLTTVCSKGLYGGLVEATYQTYRNMIDAFEIPEDKVFCPFIFPFQYANAARIGNTAATLSDTGFREDISQIQKELNSRVLLIFDEGDVLALSRVNLEKLRNIFMNTPRFMLVFAGTPKLFPIMDDVFSPIVRQFKKINLKPFETIEETNKCVRQPLEKLGITSSESIVGQNTIKELHEMSGGRPYEIQLICHFLFRRIQERRAKRLEINIDVLDDVQSELETSQDVTLRPFLTEIRNLSDDQLRALHRLAGAINHSTFEQMWFSEFLFHGTQRWTRDSLKMHFDKFCEIGVLTQTDGIIKCEGDDFDKVYCKYFARKRKIVLSINDRPFDVLLLLGLDALLRRQLKDAMSPFQLVVGGSERANLIEISEKFLDSSADPFQTQMSLARAIYAANLDCESNVKFATVSITTPWNTVYATYSVSNLNPSELDNMSGELKRSSVRASQLDGRVVIEFDELTPISLEVLTKKVCESSNTAIRDDLYLLHYHRMITAYLEKRKMEDALTNAELAFRYNPEPSHPAIANNMGYVFLIWGHYEAARSLFETSRANYERGIDAALPTYNLGILLAKQEKYKEAFARFALAKELQSGESDSEGRVGCLVVLKNSGDGKQLEFKEEMDPLLVEAIESAIQALKLMLNEN